MAEDDQATDDGALIIADDPDWPVDSQDYERFCQVFKKTLLDCGMDGVSFSLEVENAI